MDNADWLLPLNYIAFLRDIGRHFSVNRMLAAEAYKLRLEKGLSFIEFNYQLLQAYDYLTTLPEIRLHRCRSAGTTSGATSWPASTSSAGSRARRSRR